jgi:hypothetical protein
MPQIRRGTCLVLSSPIYSNASKSDSSQLILLVAGLDCGPEVPIGKWFKKFPGMTVSGEGELIKTFLVPGQIPNGDEVS